MPTCTCATAPPSCSTYRAKLEASAPACCLRALEPLSGIEHMRRARGAGNLRDLARGPGRLAAALKVDLRHDGLDLCRRGSLWIGDDGAPVERHRRERAHRPHQGRGCSVEILRRGKRLSERTAKAQRSCGGQSHECDRRAVDGAAGHRAGRGACDRARAARRRPSRSALVGQVSDRSAGHHPRGAHGLLQGGRRRRDHGNLSGDLRGLRPPRHRPESCRAPDARRGRACGGRPR